MKKTMIILMFLPFSLKAVQTDSYKKEINEWHKQYLNSKINQEETSLIVQKMYYLFKGINETFKDKKIDKTKLNPMLKAINEINAKIKTTDKGHILKAFTQLNKRLATFKVPTNDMNAAILDFLNYLKAVYEIFYKNLKDKKITFGPDKNKKLPDANKILLINKNDITNFIKNIKNKQNIRKIK